ncbi:peptidylprolyl isomerase [Psychroflexus montanilacus]|uniref:peptidylprolyl isomerase n=1 Tax=Psychroflexus montanilacus TaxID=2873598 RepID=UPI001CCEA923|nr:peptidylprolyl isomerase [Psychroflexus montanilacus]MBZ9652169.1 peptidylprolyl isomerase [Psychroflexus montanilacus]
MAILSKIRERTVFLIVIIALALFAFVLTDLFRNGGFSADKASSSVGVIGDEEIGREQFASEVENIVQQSQGRTSSVQAAKQAWENNLRRTLLKQEFEKLGLEVGTDQITDAMAEQLAGDPRFSNEAGFFDEAKLKQFIAELKVTSPEQYQQWVNFEKSMEVNAKSQLYFNMVRAGVQATLLEGQQVYHQENDNLTFEFVKIPFDSAEDVEISKSDIKSYINDHKERFQQEAKRDIEFVSFEEKASEEDNEAVLAEIEKLISGENDNFKTIENVEEFLAVNSETPYNDTYTFEYDIKGEFAEDILGLDVNEVYGPYFENESYKLTRMLERSQKPDSVKTSHILVTYDGTRVDGSVTRSKEEAKSLADSINSVVKRNSDKFAELATEFSSDRQSAEKGGDLDWIPYGALVPEFNDYVFEEARVNSYGVVETDFGFHVIYVEERTSPKDVVKLATVTKRVEPSEKTLNELYRSASKFELAAKENDFRTEADTLGKTVKPVSGINKLDESIPGAGRQRSIVKWAFEDGTKVGDVKSFDTGNGYIVARVTKKTKKGLKTPEEASAAVTPILKKRKQAEKIMAQIKENDLDAIAASFGQIKQKATLINMSNPVIPGGGREPKIVGAAFAMEEGQVSKPLQGRSGVYVIQLLEKKTAEQLPSYRSIAKEETEKRTRSLMNPRTSPIIEALKNSKEIEDNRHLIY